MRHSLKCLRTNENRHVLPVSTTRCQYNPSDNRTVAPDLNNCMCVLAVAVLTVFSDYSVMYFPWTRLDAKPKSTSDPALAKEMLLLE